MNKTDFEIDMMNGAENTAKKIVRRDLYIPLTTEWITMDNPPKKDCTAIITYEMDNGTRGMMVANYNKKKKEWDGGWFLKHQEVVAWLPILEPYKG